MNAIEPGYSPRLSTNGYALVEPRSVRMAIACLWARIGLNVVGLLVTAAFVWQYIGEFSDTVLVFIALAASLALGAAVPGLMIVALRRRIGWARLLYTGLAVLSLAYGMRDLAMVSRPAVFMALSVATYVATAAGLWFLWQRDTSAWLA